jgi:polar amino acid transport system substrate-binding protein
MNQSTRTLLFTNWLRLLAPLALVLLLLTACQSQTEQQAEQPATEQPAAEATAAPAEEAAPTQPPATETPAEPTPTPLPPTLGVVMVGVNPAFEPFVFTDENGQLVGFDIDLLNAMAAASNFEVGFVTSTFNNLFDGLNSGAFDIAVGAITVTDERKNIVNFSDPYYVSGQSPVSYYDAGQGIAVQVDNETITGPDDLTEDVRVGVKAGTTGERYVVDDTSATFVRYQEAPDALNALANGEVDAVVVDIPVITGFIRNNPEAGIKLVGGPVTQEEYAIAVAKDNPDLLAGINAALAKVREDGTYDLIFAKWFGTP